MGDLKNILEEIKRNQKKIAENYEGEIVQLKSTITDIETSNKELHSKNKAIAKQYEILVNEIEATNRTYRELKNLVDATGIPILFLDENLILKKFTSSVTKIFALVESDIGKPLSQVLDHANFEKIKTQTRKIFNKPLSQKAEPYSNQFNESFLSRTLPHRDPDGSVSGIIITFEEITENRIHEKTLTTLFENLENEVEQRNQKIKKLVSELIVAELKERKRISQLLHTDVQQYLFFIKTDLCLLKDEVPLKYKSRLDELLEHIDETLTLTRQLVIKLSPPDFKQNNLYDGISWIAKQMHEFHGFKIEIRGSTTVKLTNKNILVLLLQMIQELLFNIIKHAEVKTAKIFFEEVGGEFHIHVVDKGKGFGPLNEQIDNDMMFNFGLSHIEQQLTFIGGHLVINSSPGKGTDICLSIPAEEYILNVTSR